MDCLKAHYEQAFSNAEDGNIYEELTALDRLAHNRRVSLLDALPLPDLSSATVVDYGVGAWGAGAVFPKLKSAYRVIGIDISSAAISLSERRSAEDPAFRGRQVEYHVASGYLLPLESCSVDVFFSGECIEHIEDTELHLTEVNRVLKVGGIAIFTTPNCDPWIYRQLGLRWCVGFEHVALMSTRELVNYLNDFFVIEILQGFNQSFHPLLDKQIDDLSAERWVSGCETSPFDATSVIALVRKGASFKGPPLQPHAIEFDAARATSSFVDLELSRGFKGRMIDTGGLSIRVPPGSVRCNLIFWSHTWSGHARIRAGSDEAIVDLYSHVGGCRRVTLALSPHCEVVQVDALDSADQRSAGKQVIFFRALFITAAFNC